MEKKEVKRSHKRIGTPDNPLKVKIMKLAEKCRSTHLCTRYRCWSRYVCNKLGV